MNRIARLGMFVGLLVVAPQLGVARAQESGTSNEPSPASSELSPVDHDFVAQANLGAPFQIDSGRLADKKALTPALREYARLMVDDYGAQKDALDLTWDPRTKQLSWAPPGVRLSSVPWAVVP